MSKQTSRKLQASLAARTRFHPEEDHTELRRDLKAAKLEEYVARVVAEAPPLSPEQRDRLAMLFRPIGGAA